MNWGLMKTASMLALVVATCFFAGNTTTARAADLDGDDKSDADLIKKLINGDGPLTIHGITVYGTVDVGWTSLDHSVSPSDYANNTQPYLIQKYSNGSENSLVQSPLETSKLGVKGTEDLAGGWAAVFKLETGFNPLTGNLIDGLKSLTIDNFKANNDPNFVQQGDSSRAGQIFNGTAWGGFSNKTYGTFTYGRQNAVLYDTVQSYDPMGGAYAFGLIGGSSAVGGAGGDTQDARLDNSLKYANTVGPVRFAGQYQFATQSDGGESYQGDLGFDWKGFSIDGAYLHKTGGISASSLSSTGGVDFARMTAAGLSSDKSLDVTLSDNTAYAIAAKYDGGKWKVFGGYEYISQVNSTNPEGIANATSGDVYQDIGGYNIITVTNNKYDSAKVTQMEWVGGKVYFDPKLSLTGAYYHLSQNDFSTTNGGVVQTCAQANATKKGVVQSNCAGSEDVVSALLDYQWTKRLDVYGGVMYSQVKDGLASGFINNDATAVTVGSRIKF